MRLGICSDFAGKVNEFTQSNIHAQFFPEVRAFIPQADDHFADVYKLIPEVDNYTPGVDEHIPEAGDYFPQVNALIREMMTIS